MVAQFRRYAGTPFAKFDFSSISDKLDRLLGQRSLPVEPSHQVCKDENTTKYKLLPSTNDHYPINATAGESSARLDILS